jgi:hypothetical protein
MALLYRAGGLKAVALAAAVVIALAFWISVRHSIAAGANPLIAIAVWHLGIGASSHHFLARPHVLTLLFMAAAWRLLDRDSSGRSRAIWLLVPLTALWVNLHGGFLALLVTLAVFAAGARAWRYLIVAGACFAAALVNPYGFRLFAHLQEYLRAGWIRKLVEEFQPARLDWEGGIYFEILLFLGLGCAALLAVRGRIAHALLIAAWAHASLLSMRHIPIFFLVAGPFIAAELSTLFRHFAEPLWNVGESYRTQFRRSSMLPAVITLTLLLPAFNTLWPRTFPAGRYPVEMARQYSELLSGARLLTTDTWADYLVYELYPRQKVFFDGRTDFYGQALSGDYVTLLRGETGWSELVRRYDFQTALLPPGCPLASLLKREAGWRTRAETNQAVLLTRPPES